MGSMLRDQRGIALLLVLWTLMMLSLLVVSFAQQTRLERQRVVNVIADAKASAELQAGLSLAVAALLKPTAEPGWIHDGTFHDLKFDDRKLAVSIQDANGCMDLNRADVTQLQALLQAIGVELDAARSLAAAIVDWRDLDSFMTQHGAEASAYIDSGSAHRPGNRPFLSVAELAGVLGMTPAIADTLVPLVTVFGAGSEPNVMTAPKPVLQAIRPPEEVPDILARRLARAKVKARPSNEVPAADLGSTDLRSASDKDIAEGAEGPVFILDVVVPIAGGRALRGRAAVWLTQDAKRPYEILDWQSVQADPDMLAAVK
jgi:general secretion pathway protein K